MAYREKQEDEMGLFALFLDQSEKPEIKNIDLLFRYLNEVHASLLSKKEQAEQSDDEKLVAYTDGQISGHKLTLTIISAFFEN